MSGFSNVKLHDQLTKIEATLDSMQSDLRAVQLSSARMVGRLDALEPTIANLTPVIQVQERHAMHIKMVWMAVLAVGAHVVWLFLP